MRTINITNQLFRIQSIFIFIFGFVLTTNAESFYLTVGQTQKITLPYSVTSKVLAGQPAFTSSRPNDVQIVSQGYTSCDIKAVNSFSGYCLIHCLYYYNELDPTTGRYVYGRSGYVDFHVFVSPAKSDGGEESGGGSSGSSSTIYISPTSMTLEIGESSSLDIYGASYGEYSFYMPTSGRQIVEVYEQYGSYGIRAIGEGETKIYISKGNQTCICNITVKAPDYFTAKTTEGISVRYKNLGNKTCEVYAYGKTNPAISSSTTGKVTVPSSVNGYKVVSVGDYAFYGCKGLTSVELPSSVTTIGISAFSGCSNLTNTTIQSGVETIGSDAYYGCSSLTKVTIDNNVITSVDYTANNNLSNVFGKQVKQIIVGNNVKTIGESAFEGCTSLNSVTIPSNVESIGVRAFYGCDNISNVNIDSNALLSKDYGQFERTFENFFGEQVKKYSIGNSVKSIGERVFENCTGLTNIEIPSTVKSIGDRAFYWCTNLESITIPDNVTKIGGSAFGGCSSLRSITIPSSVTQIGDYFADEQHHSPFYACYNLESIKVDAANNYYDSRENCNAIIEKHSNTLITGCKNTVIPASITGIGGWAFDGCSTLTAINIPNNVKIIEDFAFYGCSGLTSVTIPNSVTKIGYCAFRECKSLASIEFPSNVIEFGSAVFENTAWYNNQPDGVVYAGKMAYKYKGDMPENTLVSIEEGTLGINSFAFYNCNGLAGITIPASVVSIDNWIFRCCSALTSIIVDKGNAIYDSRENCNAIIKTSDNTLIVGCKNTTIPLGVKTIGKYAFDECLELSSITIPEGVTTIENGAFDGCIGLTSVTIPSSISTINIWAFQQCSNLNSIYCYMTSPISYEDLWFGLNNTTQTNATLYVPIGSKTTYQNTEGWKQFKNIEEFDPNEVVINKTINVTIFSTGYATFYDSDFAYTLPSGLSAQVVTVSNSGKLTYKTIANSYEVIPKGIPVILVSNNKKSGTYTLTSTTESASYSGENLLHGSSLMTMTSNVNGVSTSGNSNYVYYKLAYGKSGSTNANKLGWYWGANNGAAFTIAGGKAWLALPKSSAQSLDAILMEEDDATSIDGIEQSYMNEANDAQYNMAGQRVGNGYNGIIIVNGKKVIR